MSFGWIFSVWKGLLWVWNLIPAKAWACIFVVLGVFFWHKHDVKIHVNAAKASISAQYEAAAKAEAVKQAAKSAENQQLLAKALGTDRENFKQAIDTIMGGLSSLTGAYNHVAASHPLDPHCKLIGVDRVRAINQNLSGGSGTGPAKVPVQPGLH